MGLTTMIMYYFQGMFLAELGMSAFKCSVTEKELDAAKEYAEKVIESKIEENPTLAKFQKDDYKHQFKCWSDSMVRGFKDTLRNGDRLVDKD